MGKAVVDGGAFLQFGFADAKAGGVGVEVGQVIKSGQTIKPGPNAVLRAFFQPYRTLLIGKREPVPVLLLYGDGAFFAR